MRYELSVAVALSAVAIFDSACGGLPPISPTDTPLPTPTQEPKATATEQPTATATPDPKNETIEESLDQICQQSKVAGGNVFGIITEITIGFGETRRIDMTRSITIFADGNYQMQLAPTVTQDQDTQVLHLPEPDGTEIQMTLPAEDPKGAVIKVMKDCPTIIPKTPAKSAWREIQNRKSVYENKSLANISRFQMSSHQTRF